MSSLSENPSAYHDPEIPALSTNLTAVAAWATAAALLALWEVREAYAREEAESC